MKVIWVLELVEVHLHTPLSPWGIMYHNIGVEELHMRAATHGHLKPFLGDLSQVRVHQSLSSADHPKA